MSRFMRRTRLHRFAPAVLAGWLTASLALRPTLVACPMHASAPAGAAGAAAAHQGHGHHHDSTKDPTSAPAHGCDCLGGCATATAVRAVPPKPAPLPTLELVTAAPASARDAAPRRSHYAFPFGNGPPAVSLI